MREFATTRSALLTLADWLRSWAVTVVGMESTGAGPGPPSGGIDPGRNGV
jgi:hypothetical protein